MTDDLATLLQDRLNREAAHAPPEPALGDVIEFCEGDLTRHRRRLIATAVAAVAAGVAIVAALPTLLEGGSGSDSVASAPTLVDPGVDLHGRDPATLIAACKAGTQPQKWTDLMFWPDEPRIVAYSNSTPQTSTVLVSSDGTWWADCFNADKALKQADTVMNVYLPRPSTMALMSAGRFCGDESQSNLCDTFIVDKADRLPGEVARVAVETVDGVITTVDVDQYGFVIFDYEGTVPEIYSGEETPSRVAWITKMTYLDEVGNVLAANRWTNSTYQPRRVAGVPELAKYPSLALAPEQVEKNVPITPPAGE